MRLKSVTRAVFCFYVESALLRIVVKLDELIFVKIGKLTIEVSVEGERNLSINLLVCILSA